MSVILQEKLAHLPQDSVDAIGLFLSRVSRSAELPHLNQIILYGSMARGDFNEDSDIDIAVVYKQLPQQGSYEKYQYLMKLTDITSGILFDTRTYIQPVVLWSKELEQPEKQNRPEFYRNVLMEGISLS